jgi:thymidylate synthase (FAD)
MPNKPPNECTSAPQLFVLSRPALTGEHLRYLSANNLDWHRPEKTSEAELLIEFSGRICYMSFGNGKQSPRTNAEYIRNLIEQGHESVLEHASWTFLLANVSRSFSHQFVRHRAGFSFSQLSQQYHDETDAQFVQPVGLDRFPNALDAWNRAIDSAKIAYREILKTDALISNDKERSRAIRSAARSILPNATETAIAFTANARALRHFLAVRGNTIGDTEMRLVSSLLLESLRSEAPAVVADFDSDILNDGLPLVLQKGFKSAAAQ